MIGGGVREVQELRLQPSVSDVYSIWMVFHPRPQEAGALVLGLLTFLVVWRDHALGVFSWKRELLLLVVEVLLLVLLLLVVVLLLL